MAVCLYFGSSSRFLCQMPLLRLRLLLWNCNINLPPFFIHIKDVCIPTRLFCFQYSASTPSHSLTPPPQLSMHQPIQVVEGFKDSVMSVRCGFDEIVTGCVDGAVRVHDLRTGQCRIDELGSLQFPLAGGVIGIEGKRGGSDGGAEEGGRLPPVGASRGVGTSALKRAVTCASLSHDGKCVLASCTGRSSSGSSMAVDRCPDFTNDSESIRRTSQPLLALLPSQLPPPPPLRPHLQRSQQYHLDPQQHPKTMFASCPLPFPNANAAASANNPAAPMLVLLEKATGSLLNIYQGHDHGQYPLQSCLTHTDAQVVSGCESGAVSKLPPEE